MKIRQHYWTALKMSWRVWILFQYFNLNYVPLQVTLPSVTRLPTVHCFNLKITTYYHYLLLV